MHVRAFTFRSVGRNFIFDPFSKIVLPDQFSVGDNVFIGSNAYISSEVEFSDNVMIGPRLTVIGGDHKFGVKGKFNRFLKSGDNKCNKVVIGCDSWVGANVTILKGVTIGQGAVIGAGSIVTKNVPPYTIAYGNPCRIKRDVFQSDAILKEHLQLLGFNSEVVEEVFASREIYE